MLFSIHAPHYCPFPFCSGSRQTQDPDSSAHPFIGLFWALLQGEKRKLVKPLLPSLQGASFLSLLPPPKMTVVSASSSRPPLTTSIVSASRLRTWIRTHAQERLHKEERPIYIGYRYRGLAHILPWPLSLSHARAHARAHALVNRTVAYDYRVGERREAAKTWGKRAILSSLFQQGRFLPLATSI